HSTIRRPGLTTYALLALCGHSILTHLMSLSGAKRTWLSGRQMSACDPKRTLDLGPTRSCPLEPEVIFFLLKLRTGQPEFQSHRHQSPTKALWHRLPLAR